MISSSVNSRPQRTTYSGMLDRININNITGIEKLGYNDLFYCMRS